MTYTDATTVRPADPPLTRTPTSVRRGARFARHYLEMVLAMVLGMMALGRPLNSGLELLGARPDTWRDAAPELSLIAMGVTMTVPMVAWMYVRGHRRQAGLEMCSAMLVPTAAAVVALSAGVTDNVSAVFAAEHTAMFIGMLGIMWWRREEYCSDDHGARRRRRLDGRGGDPAAH